MNKWNALKTEAEYDIALKRTIEIFHVLKGTPEGDELAMLLQLVKEYEDIHFQIPAPDTLDF
ncbi:MAG: transcriptional regulator [Mucilaginibacter sp.]|nr:transcriptional regulator [Mucilaginibacter sp.]